MCLQLRTMLLYISVYLFNYSATISAKIMSTSGNHVHSDKLYKSEPQADQRISLVDVSHIVRKKKLSEKNTSACHKCISYILRCWLNFSSNNILENPYTSQNHILAHQQLTDYTVSQKKVPTF